MKIEGVQVVLSTSLIQRASFKSTCFIQVTLVSRGVGSVTTNMQLKLATRITSAGCLLLRAVGSGVSGAIAPQTN
jgi:hypothetical protein